MAHLTDEYGVHSTYVCTIQAAATHRMICSAGTSVKCSIRAVRRGQAYQACSGLMGARPVFVKGSTASKGGIGMVARDSYHLRSYNGVTSPEGNSARTYSNRKISSCICVRTVVLCFQPVLPNPRTWLSTLMFLGSSFVCALPLECSGLDMFGPIAALRA